MQVRLCDREQRVVGSNSGLQEVKRTTNFYFLNK